MPDAPLRRDQNTGETNPPSEAVRSSPHLCFSVEVAALHGAQEAVMRGVWSPEI